MFITIALLLFIIFDVVMYAYATKALPKAEAKLEAASLSPNPDPKLLRDAATQVTLLEYFAPKTNLVLAVVLLVVMIYTHIW